MRSPAPAASQTSPIIGISSTSPRAATTPPTTTAVSPGTSRPTNAPVSRRAKAATAGYAHPPSVREASSSAPSKLGSGTTPTMTSTLAVATSAPAAPTMAECD